MFRRNITLLLLLIVVLLTFTAQVWAEDIAWKMVHGDVVQVFPQQHKILLDSKGEKQIFVLEVECQILRLGAPTSLESMRPIAPGVFQDALCWVNGFGRISHIFVNYTVQDENGVLVSYDIFGNVR